MNSPNLAWLSSREAASLIGVTRRTLYRFIDEDRSPAYRLGRVIRLKATDVESSIESSRVEPGLLKHLYPNPQKKNNRV